MKKLLLAATLCLCRAVPAFAGEPSLQNDQLLRAMQDEMSRTMGILQLNSLEKPYFSAYTVWEGTYSYVSASFGSVLKETVGRQFRRARVETFVGGYGFDNSRFNYQYPEVDAVPVEAGYDGLRFSLWSLSDKAYKKALEAFSRKKAFRQLKNMTSQPPDRSTETVRSLYFADGQQQEPSAEFLAELAQKASAAFRKYPKVQDSGASVWFSNTTQRFLNSEGSEYLLKDTLGQVELRAEGQASDGYPLKAEKTIYFLSLSSAPSAAQLEREAEALGKRISLLHDSGTMEAYIGPVLLEGGAASDFLYNLFVENISNPKEEWLENGVDERVGLLAPKIGLRVLPSFLDAYDDPSQRYWNGQPLVGSYQVDDEGVPPRRVDLVRRGKLVDLPRGRSPLKDGLPSNGHGRGSLFTFPSGYAGNVFFPSHRESGCVLPLGKLRQRLAKTCRELGLEYGIIVRAFDSFSRESSGYVAQFSAYKLYASDGHEEPVHGLEISGLTPAALRGIEAVSTDSAAFGYLERIPISVVAPALLLGDIEINKTLLKPDRKPYLEHPYFQDRAQ